MRTGSRSIIANCSSFTVNTVVKRAGGYHVISEKDGKNLGGPYTTRGEAEKRLEQVEYFKHGGTSNAESGFPLADLHPNKPGSYWINGDTGHVSDVGEKEHWETAHMVGAEGFDDAMEKNHLRALTGTARGFPEMNLMGHVQAFRKQKRSLSKAISQTIKSSGVVVTDHPDLGKSFVIRNHGDHSQFWDHLEKEHSLIENSIGAIPPGTPPQQGYDQWRNEIGSGQNQYPTGDQASPSEPQPLDEWEADEPAARTGDSPQKAIPSGWEDKRGGKGQQRPGKRPASRYQQPFGDQDVGQGKGDREERNYGPLEF